MKSDHSINKSSMSEFLNERISFREFLLIDENGENLGITSKPDALLMARDKQLDLFCISPQAKPPVCRILDFSKYIYQLRKKNNGKKISSKKNSLKEAKFSFRISENDISIKTKKIINWLEDDSSVKVVLFMRGRERQYKEIALEKCKKIVKSVQEISPLFQLKEDVKLVGSTYSFVIFKNRKAIKDEKN